MDKATAHIKQTALAFASPIKSTQRAGVFAFAFVFALPPWLCRPSYASPNHSEIGCCTLPITNPLATSKNASCAAYFYTTTDFPLKARCISYFPTVWPTDFVGNSLSKPVPAKKMVIKKESPHRR